MVGRRLSWRASRLRTMRRAIHARPDGRTLTLYAFDRPLPAVRQFDHAPGRPAGRPGELELRWNALLGEWVIISTARQERTFLPPDEYCPLCPTTPSSPFATEIPAPDFEIAVFDNRFPSLRPDAPAVASGGPFERRARAAGTSEVVVYTPDHAASLRTLPQRHVRRLVDVWTDRFERLCSLDETEYVFVFENRGREIGVTLTHPHGQIYAFPYVPPRIQTEQAAMRAHGAECLLCEAIDGELAGGARVVAEAPGWLAYVPFAARVPYEVHMAPTEHRSSLLALSDAERGGLAAILRDVQARYDGLWGFDMPYTMSMHQRPVRAADSDRDHLHVEFMPPYRSRDKLKYLAGVETGAGTFINDTSPEEKAGELRAVDVALADHADERP